jgi:hypothetical protein
MVVMIMIMEMKVLTTLSHHLKDYLSLVASDLLHHNINVFCST